MIRKIWKPRGGSYRLVIPYAFADILKLKQGDLMQCELKGKRIIITPLDSEPTKHIVEGGQQQPSGGSIVEER